ncbi:MAG: ATP-binding protein [Clostridia bacterium]|nr:ATP-binding protein [Clostridia bacterium]
MENPVWNQVLAAFEAQRARNEQENNRRRQEIAEKFPDLDALVKQRHEMVMGAVRGAFSDGKLQSAEEMMAEYNRRIAGMLLEKGYPADYLAPVCKCPLCGDTGYIYENSVQRQCECLKIAYQQALARTDGSGQETQTFAAFDPLRFPDVPLPGTDVTQREYMGIVRNKCRQFADNVGVGPIKTLLLHGGSGLGKTFLLNCVGHEAQERGVSTVSVSAYDLLTDLKNAYFSRNGENADVYFDSKLLLIDDLGMEPLMENITVEQIYNLLSSREKRRLYTVITTNLSREEMKKRYTERVISRLLDTRAGMAIAFRGQDIRLTRDGK